MTVPARLRTRRGRWPCRVALALALAAAAGGTCAPLRAQGAAAAEQRLRQQQDELDRLRRERADLERRMTELQRSARTLVEEVQNLEAQRTTTTRLLAALDQQLATIRREVDGAGRELSRAERELEAKRGILRRRVVDIYKRGALGDAEVLLSAQSFAALVARYRYLYELTRHDRSLVARVEALRNEIVAQRELLVRLEGEVARNRAEKAREASRLAALEAQRQRALAAVRRSAEETRARLTQITRDVSRLASIIATAETARRRAEMAPNAPRPAPSSIRTSDLGRLDWPVDGTILYNFGRVVNPNNTTVRWNGIGIEAAAGTPVTAIADGEVVHAGTVGTYGLTVILQHGGGDYTLYASLASASVAVGQKVRKAQVVGTVGAADPDMPPHLHLEIRPRGRAVDPLDWLRARR